MRLSVILMSGFLLASLLDSAANADSSDALARVWSDYASAKSEFESLASRAEEHLTASGNLRKMDKEERDKLISQICRLDIARNDDEADRLGKSMTEKLQSTVKDQYSTTESKASELATKLLSLSSRMSEILKNAEAFKSDETVKDDASKLYDE